MSAKTRILDYIIDRFDPRMGNQVGSSSLRKGEIEDIAGTRVVVEDAPVLDLPPIDLRDFEGRGIMTTMSDRTAGGGILTQIDNTPLNRPVTLEGGQNYMFLNPGSVWASADGVVAKMQREAARLRAATGKDPLYAPFMMAPTGKDFSTMPGEALMSFIDSTASKKVKNQLTQKVRQVVPEFVGFDGDWYTQFTKLSGDQRKAVQKVLDANRDIAGIGSGKARASVTDPNQLIGRDGTLMNVGQVSVSGKVSPSNHRTYPAQLPGEGIGRFDKEDIFVTQLFPETVDQAGKVRRTADPSNPTRPDVRSFEVRPVGGIIDDKMLKRIYGSMAGASILGSLGLPQDATAADLMTAMQPQVSKKDAQRDIQSLILDALTGLMPITQAAGEQSQMMPMSQQYGGR